MNRFDIILGKEPPKKEFPKESMTVSSQAFRELSWEQVTQMAIDEAERRRNRDRNQMMQMALNEIDRNQVTQMAINEAERSLDRHQIEFERQRQALNQTPLLTRFANMNY